MKTIKSIFDEHIYLNRKEISSLKWNTLYLTDIPITDYIIFRDYGENILKFSSIFNLFDMKRY